MEVPNYLGSPLRTVPNGSGTSHLVGGVTSRLASSVTSQRIKPKGSPTRYSRFVGNLFDVGKPIPGLFNKELLCKEVSRQMKKDRGAEAERVDTIQHSAMTVDEGTEVLYATIAFDGRHGKSPRESHQRNCQ